MRTKNLFLVLSAVFTFWLVCKDESKSIVTPVEIVSVVCSDSNVNVTVPSVKLDNVYVRASLDELGSRLQLNIVLTSELRVQEYITDFKFSSFVKVATKGLAPVSSVEAVSRTASGKEL